MIIYIEMKKKKRKKQQEIHLDKYLVEDGLCNFIYLNRYWPHCVYTNNNKV